jgi:cold shock CspA family protein
LQRFDEIDAAKRPHFVHQDHLVDVLALSPGQRVTFELIETERGPRAVNVRPV